MIKAVYVRGVMLGLNDCQGWHTFRYINLGPHFLNSAEYESICEDISLFQKISIKIAISLTSAKVVKRSISRANPESSSANDSLRHGPLQK